MAWFSGSGDQSVHEELGKAVNARAMSDGGRWPQELPILCAWANCRGLLLAAACLTPSTPFPWTSCGMHHNITWSHWHPLKLHVSFFWNNFNFQTSSIQEKICKFMWASTQFVCGWVQGITCKVCFVGYCFLFSAKCQLLVSWPLTFGLGINYSIHTTLLEWDALFSLALPVYLMKQGIYAVLCTGRYGVGPAVS